MADDLESRRRAVALLEGLGCSATIRVVVILGEPVAKERPRFSRGRTFTTNRTSDGERRIAERLRKLPKYRGNVGVACLFYRSTRQRVDVDNLLKAVLDGGTQAAVWDDDCQVTALLGITEHDPLRPRTVVCLGDHSSTLARGEAAMAPCRACGKLCGPRRKFCDGRCQRASWEKAKAARKAKKGVKS